MSAGSTSLVSRCRPFLQRAEELDAHEPVVAYYCRVHVVELLVNHRARGESSKESDTILFDTLQHAEAAKKVLDLSQGRETAEMFALHVFDDVDAADRSGKADAGTASQFYVASLFVDILAQFYDGQLPPDLAEKTRYAKYRAVHIRDCLRKGVQPTPAASSEPAPAAAASSAEQPPTSTGIGGTAASAKLPADVASHADNKVSAPAAAPPVAPSESGYAVAPSQVSAPLIVLPAPQPPPAPIVQMPVGGTGGRTGTAAGAVSRKEMTEARRKAELAASALDFADVPTARRLLREALEHLGSDGA
eukprot:gnl/TRDRNA2_/TRDRNA2_82998_c0_seq1.p1 gnl/TRDRNA2_/TRDRNA2_82998_c0~~gnl/TRDRNA2_/TRDRNA2_82998_c0_seq1.p1  ORF type:complete len:305 (-),score=66.12 gnl/TRDRNA2_/TRDRNA2_82998_c0_seq1:44-958(-)